MRRKPRQPNRQGKITRVVDEETLEGWPSRTVFLTCSTRSDLYHVAKRQGFNMLAIPMMTLCGAEPYTGAHMRRDWDDTETANVCTKCRELSKDL